MTLQQHATKRKPRSLQQQLESPDALRRLWIDHAAFPDPIMHSLCGATLALVSDDPTVTLRGVAFARAHARCHADSCIAEKEKED